MPRIASAGVGRCHVLGVCLPDAIQMMIEAEQRYGIKFSTDSTAPEICGVLGRTYVNGRQRATYTKDEKYISYHPCDLAHYNIKEYVQWLSAQ